MDLKRVGRENKERLLIVYCLPKVPTIYWVRDIVSSDPGF